MAAPLVSGFLFGLGPAAATTFGQSCPLEVSPSIGGSVTVTRPTAIDDELAIEIAPNLSFVRLETSKIRAVFGTFGFNDQYAIRSFRIKPENQEQLGSGQNNYLGAGAGRGTLESATIIVDEPDRKTVRMVWNRWIVSLQRESTTQNVIQDLTVYADGRFIEIDYVDIRYQINITDLLRPGGTTAGLHVAHGADSWLRGYITHTQSVGTYYSRYAPDGVNDPEDAGSLNYNGNFVLAVYNPLNGFGLGRVYPVAHTDVIKLLLFPTARNGIEVQNYPFLRTHPPFKGYLYAVTGGEIGALELGRAIVDGEEYFGCGDELLAEAYPYTHWEFTGWSEALAGETMNPATFELGPNGLVRPTFAPLPAEYFEDFDALVAGDEPLEWFDTESASLTQNDSLFEVVEAGDDVAFGTSSTEPDVHTHLLSSATAGLNAYEVSGRLFYSDEASGAGVTLFSQFPSQISYYRLSRADSTTFQLVPAGTSLAGDLDTGVMSMPNTWYRFRVSAIDEGLETRVRAMIWPEGEREPEDWQAEATDANPTRLTGGSFGLWTEGPGLKAVGDIALHAITDHVINTSVVGQGSAQRVPDQAAYRLFDRVQLVAVPDIGWGFEGWTGTFSSTENPLTVTVPGDVDMTATFTPLPTHTVALSADGPGQLAIVPDQATYFLGDVVSVVATPAPGFSFAGWSGDLAGVQNPKDLLIARDMAVTGSFSDVFFVESFDGFGSGEDPPDWRDTSPSNSLFEDDSLFGVIDVSGDRAFGTSSTATNIHSHYDAAGSGGLANYSYSGRMRMSDTRSGLGVTFGSGFGDEAAYYRLRRLSGQDFHVSPLGTSITSGESRSGVFAQPGIWYSFVIEMEDEGTRTAIRAKVWQEGTSEPGGWQIECFDESDTRRRQGTIGVWSFSEGQKLWDDISVAPLAPPPSDLVLTVDTVGNGSVVATPDLAEYTLNEEVSLEAVPGPGWAFIGWSGDLTGVDNPDSIFMVGDRSVTANFAEITEHTLELVVAGEGRINADPDQATYLLGDVVSLTAVPDPGFSFVGWSGGVSGTENPITITITGDASVLASFGDTLIDADFNGLAAGSDPPGWVDSRSNNSLSVDDSIFQVFDVDGDPAFGTASTATNIHSHFVDAGSSSFSGYRFTGRMQMTDSKGGIGVTFGSAFPSAMSYYRLRRFGNTSFRLSPVGTQVTSGSTDTGVVPDAGAWYRFAIEFEDAGGSTEIRASVWRDGTAAPGTWQIECTDDSATRRMEGTVGVWCFAGGSKLFDDLVVEPIAPPASDLVLTVNTTGSGQVDATPDQSQYTEGDVVELEAIADPGWAFIGWSGSLTGTENPTSLTMGGDESVTATFAEITQHSLSLTAEGSGQIEAAPDLLLYPLGSVVTLRAIPDPGFSFTGWNGDAVGLENPFELTITGDASVTATFEDVLYAEDFNAFGAGADPPNWIDTAQNNSLAVNDSLFKVSLVGGETALGTTSTATNIHSPYDGPGAAEASGYALGGRMLITQASGGIGVTFGSLFPGATSYYRLRRFGNTAFHISPLGTSITAGSTTTSVVPDPGTWYRFLIEFEDEGAATAIRAKVWQDGQTEPAAWQIECSDDSPTRLTAGTFGLWSFSSGGKYWDDFRVAPLGPPPTDLVLTLETEGDGSVVAAPDLPQYTLGDSVELEAIPDAGWAFGGWSGDLDGTDNPATLTMLGDRSVTATFIEITPQTLTRTADGPGTILADPDQATYLVGDTVTLTAVPDPGFLFTGWSGDLSGLQNPTEIVIVGDASVTARFENVLYFEDFNDLEPGSDPPDWIDTAAGNSLVPNNGLFGIVEIGGETAFGTSSTATNIHSHLVVPGSELLSNYELSGRMRFTSSKSGIGVTIGSRFPGEAAYYRLRRYSGQDFQISPLGTSIGGGSTESGVAGQPNTWYRFRLQFTDTGTQTEIRARVWADGTPEPSGWQVDCFDASPTRILSGTIGVWSFNAGTKVWDDLRVAPL